jgi:hypothetical protein
VTKKGLRPQASGLGVLTLLLAATVSADPAPAVGWEVRIPDKVELAVGSGSALPIAISVDRGLTISRDAALIVDLDTGSGSDVIIKRRRLGRADAVDPGADEPRFTVPLRAEGSGDRTVGVRVRFWLCGGRVCRPIDVRRSVALTVQ